MTLRLILHCKITDETGFDAIRKELPTSVEQNEPGTLDYRWFRNGDDVLLLDEYESPDAFVVHFNQNQQNGLLDRCLAAIEIQGVHAVGDTNEAADAILTQLGTTHYEQVAGFTRSVATTTT